MDGGVTKSDMKAEHEVEGEPEEINYLGRGCTTTHILLPPPPPQELSDGRTSDKSHVKPPSQDVT